jgi:hypothetical protein
VYWFFSARGESNLRITNHDRAAKISRICGSSVCTPIAVPCLVYCPERSHANTRGACAFELGTISYTFKPKPCTKGFSAYYTMPHARLPDFHRWYSVKKNHWKIALFEPPVEHPWHKEDRGLQMPKEYHMDEASLQWQRRPLV